MSSWSVQVTDKSYVPQGELINIKDFQLEVPLGKTRTCQLKIRFDNPLAPLLIPEDVEGIKFQVPYIKAYRNGHLEFFGPVITSEEIGEGEKSIIHVNAAGPEWVLGKRYWTLEKEGYKIGSENKAKIFADAVNSRGLKFNAVYGTVTAAPYETSPVKYLSEVLKDLSEGVEGFDWLVYPKEPEGIQIGTMLMEEKIGRPQPNAVFEYGGGRNNVASYKRVADRTTQINRAYNFLPGGPGVGEEAKYISPISEEIWDILEEAISVDVLNTGLRVKLVEEHINIRKDPRQTFTFEPAQDDGTGRVPQPVSDYGLGDTIPIRIFKGGEEPHFSGEVRVWGVKYTLDENLKEKTILTLSNQ